MYSFAAKWLWFNQQGDSFLPNVTLGAYQWQLCTFSYVIGAEKCPSFNLPLFRETILAVEMALWAQMHEELLKGRAWSGETGWLCRCFQEIKNEQLNIFRLLWVLLSLLASDLKNKKFIWNHLSLLYPVRLFANTLMARWIQTQGKASPQSNGHVGEVLLSPAQPCTPLHSPFSCPSLPSPLCAMWCIIFIPSTNLLTKRFYFLMNLYPNVISLKFICILNLISDCGSKEFNTLLRGF